MSDKELINNCISTYYAGCLESDPNKIKEAFDENAIREAYLGMIFVDSFSFLKKNDTWRIYTKLFHVET